MLALGLALHREGASLEEILAPRAAPAHPGARLLIDEWRRLDAMGGFIVGIHVPSRRLASVLGGLSLYEPLDDGRDFRVRLAGTAVLRRFGRDTTGLTLSQIFAGAQFTYHRALLRRVQKSGEPFFLDVQKLHEGRRHLRFEILGLRVFSPDCRHSWIMTAQFLQPD
ncbi:MAG TPA: PAS domain-containing protein [Rhizomicrobium sp.]